MTSLVIAEHDNQSLKAATLNAVTAALACGGDVHLLVAGHQAGPAVEAAKHPLAPGIRMVYLLLAVPVDTITGLALVMQSHANQLSSFAAGSRDWGPSVLSDIHQGGAIMWIIGDLIMMAALIPLGIAFVRADAREAKRIDQQLASGTLPTSQKSAWKPLATSHFPTAPPLGGEQSSHDS